MVAVPLRVDVVRIVGTHNYVVRIKMFNEAVCF